MFTVVMKPIPETGEVITHQIKSAVRGEHGPKFIVVDFSDGDPALGALIVDQIENISELHQHFIL